MKILAIETSCDETAAAVLADAEPRPQILSNVVVSQIDIFAAFGGVIPEVAARSHLEAILPVIDRALADADCNWDSIDAIAVTHTPGLLGSLLIGTLAARTLAILHDKPLYAVHHLKSHIFASWLRDEPKPIAGSADSLDLEQFWQPPELPVLALVVSGGHTQIIVMKDYNDFEIVGTTRDDAVGECFDKIAKILGLPYPGGPAIANAAQGIFPSGRFADYDPSEPRPGDPFRYHLPHPHVADLDFSFSGLKTAVLRAVQSELGQPINFPSHQLAPLLSARQVADFAAGFEQTAADILTEKMVAALEKYPDTRSIVVAGGVSANQTLRHTLCERLADSVRICFPELKFTGDNGAMVGAAALFEIKNGVAPIDPYHLDIMPRSAIV